eukprot:7387701-Prymnesium_polylepis.2
MQKPIKPADGAGAGGVVLGAYACTGVAHGTHWYWLGGSGECRNTLARPRRAAGARQACGRRAAGARAR